MMRKEHQEEVERMNEKLKLDEKLRQEQIAKAEARHDWSQIRSLQEQSIAAKEQHKDAIGVMEQRAKDNNLKLVALREKLKCQ